MALARKKSRPSDKPFLKTFSSQKAYAHAGRVPEQYKREFRRSARTTYVIKSHAVRVIDEGAYHDLLRAYGWLYSTSANASGHGFDAAFATQSADIIIEDDRGLFEDVPSNIYRINHRKKRRIR